MADCPLCRKTLSGFHPELPWLARCAECGLVLQPERPDDPVAVSQAHYDEGILAHRTRIRPRVERIAGERWRWLASRLGPDARPGRLLEVGSATGEFLARARRAGWTIEGVETSPSFRRGALAWHGIEAQAEPFRPGEAPRGRFDGVALLHVFEHLADPLGFLADVRRVLVPGGWLFLAVPNLASWSDRPYGAAALHLAQQDHLFHYDPETLSRTLEVGGFRAEAIETREARHHLWIGLYAWLARRRGGRAGRPADGASDAAGRRWRSNLPYWAGDVCAPLTWPYRRWASRCGGGHEILGLFRAEG